jgi:hypothetical protein
MQRNSIDVGGYGHKDVQSAVSVPCLADAGDLLAPGFSSQLTLEDALIALDHCLFDGLPIKNADGHAIGLVGWIEVSKARAEMSIYGNICDDEVPKTPNFKYEIKYRIAKNSMPMSLLSVRTSDGWLSKVDFCFYLIETQA